MILKKAAKRAAARGGGGSSTGHPTPLGTNLGEVIDAAFKNRFDVLASLTEPQEPQSVSLKELEGSQEMLELKNMAKHFPDLRKGIAREVEALYAKVSEPPKPHHVARPARQKKTAGKEDSLIGSTEPRGTCPCCPEQPKIAPEQSGFWSDARIEEINQKMKDEEVKQKMWTDEETDETIRGAVESIFAEKEYEDPNGRRNAVDACLLILQMINKEFKDIEDVVKAEEAIDLIVQEDDDGLLG